MTTAEKIRQARKAAGLTQKQLAKKLGITVGAISQCETGQRNPKITTLYKIARALNVSLPEVMGDDAPHGSPEEWKEIINFKSPLPDCDFQRSKLLILYDSVTDPARGLIVGYAEGVAANPENRRDK